MSFKSSFLQRGPLLHADYKIQVDVKLGSRTDAPDEDLRTLERKLQEALTKLAPIVVGGYVATETRQYEQLVEILVGDHSPSQIDFTKAQMEAGARRAVFEGTQWLTSAQIAKLARLGVANPSGTVNRWKNGKKVFALKHGGQDLYPNYLFDDEYRPLDAVEKVIKALPGFTPSRLASWFESPNGLLGGRRPREVLAEQPERVVEAAQRTMDAELYAA
jgi:hypothetical protein